MKSRATDPRRLDVEAFAADGGHLEGAWPLAALERLREVVASDAPEVGADVQWSARGERRKPNAVEPQTWLHLQARTTVWMECQRCLQPVAVPLDVQRSFRFVPGEDAAARLDAESEDDVLELGRDGLDLPELIEDELVLALPLVPRHEDCVQLAGIEPPSDADDGAHPFATLAAYKRRLPQ